MFAIVSLASFLIFLRRKFSPLWLMLSVWFVSIGIAQLHLSVLELTWPAKFWFLIFISLASFTLGVLVFDRVWHKHRWWQKIKILKHEALNTKRLSLLIYILFVISLGALYLFYKKAGNFPLLASDPDQFRFAADTQVPGLINYLAQLARVFIPLSFFLMFYETFSWRKHWGQILICLVGTGFITLFASRTQIFFIDLWVMGLYLLMRKPSPKQALKFYPFFLAVSLVVLAAVPLIRQYKSYGPDYLGRITGIDTSHYNKLQKALVPIYVGISFNQQALLHADMYYQTHPVQNGKVSLDPFTNILGLHQFKSDYDLGAIFYSWWNTGTYLFPFVQDFGEAAFYIIPFFIAGILTMLWHYWQTSPNFLSINLYAYALFFIVFSVYMSFTVRAEMYLDLALLFASYLFVSRHES